MIRVTTKVENFLGSDVVSLLQSSQVKRTQQDSIYEFIIQKLNPLVVVDFSFISAFFHP